MGPLSLLHWLARGLWGRAAPRQDDARAVGDAPDDPVAPDPGKATAALPNGLDEDATAQFSLIQADVSMEELKNCVLRVLQKQQPQHPAARAGRLPAFDPVLFGSFNILFSLVFDAAEGYVRLCYLVKIPINGTLARWDTLSQTALEAERATMDALRQRTSIPVPRVYDACTTADNPVRCSYLILEFIENSLPLSDVWFVRNGQSTTRAFREDILDALAHANAQLGQFQYHQGGSPCFSSELDRVVDVQPARTIDEQAMADRDAAITDDNENGDPDYLYVPFGPTDDPVTFYTAPLDRHLPDPADRPFQAGLVRLLRLLIELALARLARRVPGSDKGFVLAHPDYSPQNILVSACHKAGAGLLCAVIDWDGVVLAPRTRGHTCLPTWLTRDWDSLVYRYPPTADDLASPGGGREDPPETLAALRAYYAQRIGEHVAAFAQTHPAAWPRDAATATQLCRASLLTDNLAIAANDPACRVGIMRRVVDEAWAALARKGGKSGGSRPVFVELVEQFGGRDDVDAGLEARLAEAVDALVDDCVDKGL